MGYNNYYQVLNSKDYGVPQNRERVFIISIRKDIDKGSFAFPEKQELKLCLADILDKEVDEKYYLSDKLLNFFIQNSKDNEAKGNGFRFSPTDGRGIAKTITTRAGCRMDDNFIKVDTILQVGNLKTDSKRKDPQVGRVYSPCGICPTLNTMQGGQREPKVLVKSDTNISLPNKIILIPEKTKKGYKEAYPGDCVYINRPHQKRGCVQHNITQILKTSCNDLGVVTKDYRIRKLTPRECFALMGFQKEDADKLSNNGISNTQLYKQAGNSIVVDVLMGIFSNLLCLFNSEYTELKEK